MAETSAERAAAIRAVRAETASEPEAVQVAALRALVPEAGQETANRLWLLLVGGLLLLTAVALVGLLFMIGDGDDKTSPDLVLGAFSTLLAGVLGLFIKSPARSN